MLAHCVSRGSLGVTKLEAITIGQVCAVMVGLDCALGIRGVDVKGIEMRADVFDGGEFLKCSSLAWILAGVRHGPGRLLTCVIAAPVSRILLFVDTGGPSTSPL